MNRKKTNFIVIFIYLLAIFLSFYTTNKSSSFDYLNTSNSFILEAEDFSPDFSSHIVEPNKSLLSYSTKIKESTFTDLSSLNRDYYSLFIHKLADNAFSVYFNDQLIGSRGDFIDNRSNLWNGYTVFQVPVSLVQENNTLTFKTSSIYRSGLSAYPLYITTDTVTPLMTYDLEILTSLSTSITLGFIVASILMCILLLLLTKNDKKVFVFTAMSSIFFLIYSTDYLAIDYLAIDYLIYKKIVMSGLFFGIGFYSYTISAYYKHKPLKWLGHIYIIAFIYILTISPDMITFKYYYSIYYIAILVNIIYWIVLSLVRFKVKRRIVFFTGFTLLLLYGGTNILIDILGKSSTIASPFIYVSIIGVMPILLVYESFIEKDTAVDVESAKSKTAFLDSITDPLTHTWNQRYLYSKSSTNLLGSVVCILDFDDFKKINDTYGHIAGDKVIIETCDVIKSKIRGHDDLIRYGGDEFVLILYDCHLEEAIERISSLLNTLDSRPIYAAGHQLNVTLSIGMYKVREETSVQEVIKRADAKLYQAKLNGKNQLFY